MIDIPEPYRFENMLNGKTVVVGTGASISIYRVPDLVRDLRREGADVIVIMTANAQELINPEVMRWASENQVITKITGKIEHISLFQTDPKNTAFLVSPASYDLVGKMANGISDDPVSLSFSFAHGNGNPVVIAPAMHKAMMTNPINADNLKKLQSSGVLVVPPGLDTDKAKLSQNDQIIDYVARSFYGTELKGKNLMIISGHSRVKVDAVRDLVNGSTGFSGYWFCRNAFRLGSGSITFIGNSSYAIPQYANFHCSETGDEFLKETVEALQRDKIDIVVVPAALPDFKISNDKRNEKLESGLKQHIDLIPEEKLIYRIRNIFSGKIVVFSLNSETDPDKIRRKYSKADPDIIVHNSISEGDGNFGERSNNYTLIERDRVVPLGVMNKREMTLRILREAAGTS
ncbi:MAG: bifunctional phosphopantothenoylcysteine decarboxylase/phosphopantothenate--cysteine ligase CoaBC [Thermoplasmataceae archaeon]